MIAVPKVVPAAELGDLQEVDVWRRLNRNLRCWPVHAHVESLHVRTATNDVDWSERGNERELRGNIPLVRQAEFEKTFGIFRNWIGPWLHVDLQGHHSLRSNPREPVSATAE